MTLTIPFCLGCCNWKATDAELHRVFLSFSDVSFYFIFRRLVLFEMPPSSPCFFVGAKLKQEWRQSLQHPGSTAVLELYWLLSKQTAGRVSQPHRHPFCGTHRTCSVPIYEFVRSARRGTAVRATESWIGQNCTSVGAWFPPALVQLSRSDRQKPQSRPLSDL